MPQNVHPLLRQDEEETQPVDAPAETLDAPVEALADSPAADDTAAPEAIAEAVEEFYRLNKASAYKDLAELAENDPEFRNVVNTLVGRKAAPYKQKTLQLEQQLAELTARQHEVERARFEDDPELAEKLRTDPAFAARYHSRPEDPRAVALRNELTSTIDEIIDEVAEHIPQDVQDRYRNALAQGWYDIKRDANEVPVLDPAGNQIKLTAVQSIRQFQRQVSGFAAATRNRQPAPRTAAAAPAAAAPVSAPPAAAVATEAPPAAPAPRANARLAEASPDLSRGASGGGGVSMSREEYQQLNPKQRMALFPSTDDYERALADGRIK